MYAIKYKQWLYNCTIKITFTFFVKLDKMLAEAAVKSVKGF